MWKARNAKDVRVRIPRASATKVTCGARALAMTRNHADTGNPGGMRLAAAQPRTDAAASRILIKTVSITEQTERTV
jgi:hypothetical protein